MLFDDQRDFSRYSVPTFQFIAEIYETAFFKLNQVISMSLNLIVTNVFKRFLFALPRFSRSNNDMMQQVKVFPRLL